MFFNDQNENDNSNKEDFLDDEFSYLSSYNEFVYNNLDFFSNETELDQQNLIYADDDFEQYYGDSLFDRGVFSDIQDETETTIQNNNNNSFYSVKNSKEKESCDENSNFSKINEGILSPLNSNKNSFFHPMDISDNVRKFKNNFYNIFGRKIIRKELIKKIHDEIITNKFCFLKLKRDEFRNINKYFQHYALYQESIISFLKSNKEMIINSIPDLAK